MADDKDPNLDPNLNEDGGTDGGESGQDAKDGTDQKGTGDNPSDKSTKDTDKKDLEAELAKIKADLKKEKSYRGRAEKEAKELKDKHMSEEEKLKEAQEQKEAELNLLRSEKAFLAAGLSPEKWNAVLSKSDPVEMASAIKAELGELEKSIEERIRDEYDKKFSKSTKPDTHSTNPNKKTDKSASHASESNALFDKLENS